MIVIYNSVFDGFTSHCQTGEAYRRQFVLTQRIVLNSRVSYKLNALFLNDLCVRLCAFAVGWMESFVPNKFIPTQRNSVWARRQKSKTRTLNHPARTTINSANEQNKNHISTKISNFSKRWMWSNKKSFDRQRKIETRARLTRCRRKSNRWKTVLRTQTNPDYNFLPIFTIYWYDCYWFFHSSFQFIFLSFFFIFFQLFQWPNIDSASDKITKQNKKIYSRRLTSTMKQTI